MRRAEQPTRKTPLVRRTFVAATLLAFAVPSACVEVDEEEESAEAEEAWAEEAEPRSNPGNGTGSASWTVVHSAGSMTFSMSMSDGVGSQPVITGTPPPFSALPIDVTNADGEPLHIKRVVIQGKSYRNYSGSFEITIDSDTAEAACTNCYCGLNPAPPCKPILATLDCWSDGSSCAQKSCGGGGGGLERLDLDFTSTPGAPL